MAQEQKPKKVKIILMAPHTHAGEKYKKGDEIEVRPEQAKRLIQQKIAKGA